MRVLLDECLPKDLRKYLVGHECETVPHAGFAGKRNGELLALAEGSGWEVLLTMDRGIPYQQNLTQRGISLVIIRARSNRISDLLPRVNSVLAVLRSIKPGETVQVD